MSFLRQNSTVKYSAVQWLMWARYSTWQGVTMSTVPDIGAAMNTFSGRALQCTLYLVLALQYTMYLAGHYYVHCTW